MTEDRYAGIPSGYKFAAQAVTGFDGGNHPLSGDLWSCDRCGSLVLPARAAVHDSFHAGLFRQAAAGGGGVHVASPQGGGGSGGGIRYGGTGGSPAGPGGGGGGGGGGGILYTFTPGRQAFSVGSGAAPAVACGSPSPSGTLCSGKPGHEVTPGTPHSWWAEEIPALSPAEEPEPGDIWVLAPGGPSAWDGEKWAPLPDGGIVSEYAAVSAGGWHLRPDEEAVERAYPLRQWIADLQGDGTRVQRRKVIVVSGWEDVPRAER